MGNIRDLYLQQVSQGYSKLSKETLADHLRLGDIFQIDITNNMVDNGYVSLGNLLVPRLTHIQTSMHWHGFNQVNSCTEDG